MGARPWKRKRRKEGCHEDVRKRTVPQKPKCGHTLERDVTANLLSTILSFGFPISHSGPDSISAAETAASRTC